MARSRTYQGVLCTRRRQVPCFDSRYNIACPSHPRPSHFSELVVFAFRGNNVVAIFAFRALWVHHLSFALLPVDPIRVTVPEIIRRKRCFVGMRG